MINHDDAQICAGLVEDFLEAVRDFDVVRSEDSKKMETALVELRTMPAETMSHMALEVACGVLNSYIKRQSRYQFDRDQIQSMQEIRQRIHAVYPEQHTIH